MVFRSQFNSTYPLLGACAVSIALLGCVHPRDRVISTLRSRTVKTRSITEPASPNLPRMHGPYDFKWRLTGTRRAGPSQVFSTSEGIWLYFDREDHLPVVFASDPRGNEVLLRPVRVAPYVFVRGDWSRLVFRLGHLVASAIKHMPAVGQEVSSHDQLPAGPPPYAGAQAFRASPQDRNMRRVLKRWAEAAGWTFAFDHWTLDVDIPVSASVDLGSEFTAAVRALLASTEMSDRPAQPCFYTNKVLRVIGASQQCDPRRHPADDRRKQAFR